MWSHARYGGVWTSMLQNISVRTFVRLSVCHFVRKHVLHAPYYISYDPCSTHMTLINLSLFHQITSNDSILNAESDEILHPITTSCKNKRMNHPHTKHKRTANSHCFTTRPKLAIH